MFPSLVTFFSVYFFWQEIFILRHHHIDFSNFPSLL